MKSKHYINFGSMKCATSWIWSNIHRDFNYYGSKEPPLYIVDSTKSYVEYFEKYQSSLNFNPNLWMLDSNQLGMLSAYASHSSIIFRNPYEYANSLYNFWNCTLDSGVFLSTFKLYFDYQKIIHRLPWIGKIFYYDDIQNNPHGIIDELTDYLEIPRITVSNSRVNQTVYRNHLKFNELHCIMLNDFVSRFEDTVQKDLSHWKKNASN